MKYRLTTASLRVLLIVSMGLGTTFTLTSCHDHYYRNGYHRGPALYGHKVNRNRNGNWNRNPYNNPNRYRNPNRNSNRNPFRNPYRQGNGRYGW